MKRGKDDEKMMGPMFPRLHVNDTEKGGPRAPPRNKMALYEQLSIPSQRFSNGLMHHTANNTAANSVPHSSQGDGNERGMFFSHQMSPKHHEKQYSQYTDLNTPLDQVEQRKKQDEDDYIVPIFIHPVPSQECPKYTNVLNKDKDMLERTTRQSSSDRQSTAVLEENITANKRKFSSSVRCSIPEDDQNIDPCNDSESHEDGSCRSLETGNLERAESVSETSILDSESGPDITPDDVVGIIGQKHFWKARRAIANQQRVFAVQLFELHRLIKVQKLVAASPHLLEDSAYLGKPIKPSPRKKLQVEYTIKSIPNISKQKPELEKPSNKKEGSAENTLEKKSLSPLDQNPVPPSPLISTPSNGSNHNATPWCLNQPQGHHWLIPVMSPSEGLVYKPYPGPGFAGPPYGAGQNPVMGNFVIPGYGPHHHHPPQYQLPSYPLPGPPSYFPHYNMPMMNTSALSGSSVEQMNPPPVPTRPTRFPPGEAHFTTPNLKNGPVSDIEVQASTGSSWSERLRDNPTADVRNMLSLFPTSPVKDNLKSGPQIAESEPARVIRVVPHNARTASESAARIFLSIQEERKQNDSV